MHKIWLQEKSSYAILHVYSLPNISRLLSEFSRLWTVLLKSCLSQYWYWFKLTMRDRRTTNSFKRKLFGQSTADDDDFVPIEKSEDDVRVHPLSAFRKYWEIVTICLVIYTVLVLPFRAAFYLDFYEELDRHHNLFQQLQVRSYVELDLVYDLVSVERFPDCNIREALQWRMNELDLPTIAISIHLSNDFKSKRGLRKLLSSFLHTYLRWYHVSESSELWVVWSWRSKAKDTWGKM